MGGLMLQMPGRRRRLLDVVILPCFVAIQVALTIYTEGWNLHLDDKVNLIIRLPLKSVTMARTFMFLAITVAVLLLIICGATVLVMHYRERWKQEPPTNRAIVIILSVAQLSLFAMMWSSLAVFYTFRDKTINKDDGDDPQLEWSFGQILAVTTWVPVLIDFFYTLFCKSILILRMIIWKPGLLILILAGMRKGLEGHIPGDYHVVSTIDLGGPEGVPLDRAT